MQPDAAVCGSGSQFPEHTRNDDRTHQGDAWGAAFGAPRAVPVLAVPLICPARSSRALLRRVAVCTAYQWPLAGLAKEVETLPTRGH